MSGHTKGPWALLLPHDLWVGRPRPRRHREGHRSAAMTPADREALARLLSREPEPDPIPEPIWPEDTVLLICVLIAAIAFWLRLT